MTTTEGETGSRVSVTPARMEEALAGVLVGTAVGDALGLPMEGLSARRQRRLFPGTLRHRFLGRWGMISDDTEHTFLLAQCLLESPDDSRAFQRCLACRLRWWLLALPAGVGFATLRAILRLWMRISPELSGVISAGNGPAMRSAVLGVYFSNDAARRNEFVQASAELTHRDSRAVIAARAVAETSAWMTGPSEDDVNGLWEPLANLDPLPEWQQLVATLSEAFSRGESVEDLARRIGAAKAVSGYAFQSVPVAIYSAVRHRTCFATALSEAIACGGDTDTVGAITGALAGPRIGVSGIPEEWRKGVRDFPISVRTLGNVAERLGRQLAGENALGPLPYFWPAILPRNLVFLATVLGHGIRRLLPPY